MSMRSEGNKELANVLKNADTAPVRITDEQALAVFVDAKLTKRTYNIMRSPVKDRYPPYDNICAAKQNCRPSNEHYKISELLCKVDLQALLDHTCLRLMKLVDTEVRQLMLNGCSELRLISKWGCDGSSAHAEYKQRFMDSTSSDAYMFLTSFVPLRLVGAETLVWANPRTSSTRFCRPICIRLMKETSDLIVKEYERVQREISQLKPFRMLMGEHELVIKYDLVMTMVDGKIINAITQTTSAQRCYICNATSATFNNIEKMRIRPTNTEYLQFGISNLHCWIRSFECLLHIAYRLSFRTWIKTAHIEEFNQNKARIQKDFFAKLGLHVDKPRSGYGNSNDGNTARKFFAEAEMSSEITGIDLGLIIKIRTILITISCGKEVNTAKFRSFALDTAKKYVDLYGWYKMPTTLHKVLIHGHEIIKEALVPIGLLSEDAQEAMNKEVRRMRSYHSFKGSRERTMQDIFHGLLVASDPIVSYYRHGQPCNTKDLPREVEELLTIVE